MPKSTGSFLLAIFFFLFLSRHFLLHPLFLSLFFYSVFRLFRLRLTLQFYSFLFYSVLRLLPSTSIQSRFQIETSYFHTDAPYLPVPGTWRTDYADRIVRPYDGSNFGARALKTPDRESTGKHCRLSLSKLLYLLTISTRYVLIHAASLHRYLFGLCPAKITGLEKTRRMRY